MSDCVRTLYTQSMVMQFIILHNKPTRRHDDDMMMMWQTLKSLLGKKRTSFYEFNFNYSFG
jgi:hypothetical protein